MKGLSLLLALTVAFRAEAFLPATNLSVPTHSCSANTLRMGGAKGVASTRPGKELSVKSVQDKLADATLIFSMKGSGISGDKIVTLRKTLPEGVTCQVVKNKLMRIAVKGTQFESITDDMTRGENMWIFANDDSLSESIKFVRNFISEAELKETHNLKYGVMDGKVLTAEEVVAISKLPTKKELYQKIAVAIKSVPTKVGKGINLVPTKVGRSIKLAFADENKEE